MENNVYVVEPSTVRFDDKYVVFNPVHSELEYEATKENIKRLGQLDPILMLNGLCIDGRHRTRIAEELGEMVRWCERM
jgi:ParB-like chromosome segregation protein Spo0J